MACIVAFGRYHQQQKHNEDDENFDGQRPILKKNKDVQRENTCTTRRPETSQPQERAGGRGPNFFLGDGIGLVLFCFCFCLGHMKVGWFFGGNVVWGGS